MEECLKGLRWCCHRWVTKDLSQSFPHRVTPINTLLIPRLAGVLLHIPTQSCPAPKGKIVNRLISVTVALWQKESLITTWFQIYLGFVWFTVLTKWIRGGVRGTLWSKRHLVCWSMLIDVVTQDFSNLLFSKKRVLTREPGGRMESRQDPDEHIWVK